MKKKIIGIFVIMLMLFSNITTILFSNKAKVEASGGSSNVGVGLDYNFMWNVTKKLSYIINTSYTGNEIRKGRSFGTKGENDAADYLYYDIMGTDLNLEDVHEEQLGNIEGKDSWYYNWKVEALDFQLTINNASNISYPYPKNVPRNETFVWPSGSINNIDGTPNYHDASYNRSYENLKIQPMNLTDDWFLTEELYYTLKNYNEVTTFSYIVGNATYIPQNETIPSDQEGRFFLIDEEAGCEYKLDNITNATGVLLIHNETKGYTAETSEYQYQIVRIQHNESNLSTIIDMLKTGTHMIAENVNDVDTITFTYNCSDWLDWWPDDDFLILMWLPPSSWYGYNPAIDLYWKTARTWIRNEIMHCDKGWCYGFIIYSAFPDLFVMDSTSRWWKGWGNDAVNQTLGYYFNAPYFQIFSVNNSIGKFLENHHNYTTISGFINQQYTDVEAYNVVGNITVPHNPQNRIVVISNRYDGWWSQAPGDSGAGAGIVLGVAKYMKDHDITPKYNLTFLMTCGEEYAFRGAWHYSDSHPNDKIIRWIGVDQIGFWQHNTTFNLGALCKDNITTGAIVWSIVNQSKYEDVTDNGFKKEQDNIGVGFTDSVAWLTRSDCDTLCFDQSGDWDRHHTAGINFTEGDSLKYMNRTVLNYTFDIFWNVTKYFTVNPNCHFHDVSYEATNATEGTTPDSIKATFTVKSILPSDLVRLNASLYNASTNLAVPNVYQELDFVINTTGVQHSITLSMPSNVKEGDYYIKLTVYNSTHRINRTLGYTNFSNDTKISPTFHLSQYRTIGDIRIGTATANAHDIIRGSKFTPVEDAIVHNITAYINGNSSTEPTYQCMIYRMSDGNLTAYSNQVACDETGWVMFTFSTKPILIEDTQYMLTIWGNNEDAIVYSTPVNAANAYCNASYTFGTPPSTIEWDLNLALQQYSIFCWYTPDIPQITSVSAIPHTVGFGYNVTISADVTDRSGVNQVKAQLNTPEGPVLGNYMMTHISGNTYQYVFSNTWDVGQYNYTIWATDNSSNVNSSSGHHFHISADATISIATLQDSYTGDEYINITDPPNPPENYTLVDRGLTWDRYYNALTGQNILEASIRPINYQEDNDTWTPINTTLSLLPSNHPAYVIGYRKGNDHGLYGLYFKSNTQQEWPAAFTYNRSDDPTTYAIRSKLVGVGYVDPVSDWAYEYLQSVQSSQGQTMGNTIRYEDVFTGTDVTWSYSNTGLKEEIILSNTTKTALQNHPPSQYGLNNESSYLVFITKLDYLNLNLYNGSEVLDGNVTITDSGVDFKDTLGRFKCALPLGDAYELNNDSVRQKLTYRIIHLNGNTYLLSGVRLTDLTEMTFPVVIDPSLTIYTDSDDGYLSNSSSNYAAVWNATSSSGFASFNLITIGQNKVSGFPTSTYTINRGYVFFNTSVLPSNAIIDNATLGLYKCNDYSTTDFDITVQNGQPTYPHDPLQSSDYYKNYYSGDGGSLNTTLLDDGYNNISLNDDGITWVNRTGGWTKLCLRSSWDINGVSPSGNQYVSFYTSEQGASYTPKLIICYRNQSKIKNTGLTDIKGYLLIQVQFYNTTQRTWVVEDDTVNETSPQTITMLHQLALDKFFNGKIMASGLRNGEGLYRVYTEFRDFSGNVLRTDDGTELKAWWEFNKI